MTPYYEDASVRLYHGDCLDVLPSLGVVDHVITDPPYEDEAHTLARRQRSAGVVGVHAIDFAPMDAVVRAGAARWAARLASRWVLVFCQVEAVHMWRSALVAEGASYLRTQVWVKPDGAPQFTGDRPGMGYESIVTAWAGPSRPSWNGGGRRGVYTHMVGVGGGTPNEHPTQKPIALMSELIGLFTDEGDTVADFFAGSGTTGVACKLNGRKAILIEKEEKYCEVAAKRLRETEPGRLFDKLPKAKPQPLPMDDEASA